MRVPLIFRIAAPIILIIFTIVSCDIMSIPQPEPYSVPVTIHTVPVGKGDINITYLDENYLPTVNDIGKMALFVENNEYTQNVLVISEIRNNHNVYARPEVFIRLNGEKVKNGQMPPHGDIKPFYIEHGESLKFDLSFMPNSALTPENIFDAENFFAI